VRNLLSLFVLTSIASATDIRVTGPKSFNFYESFVVSKDCKGLTMTRNDDYVTMPRWDVIYMESDYNTMFPKVTGASGALADVIDLHSVHAGKLVSGPDIASKVCRMVKAKK